MKTKIFVTSLLTLIATAEFAQAEDKATEELSNTRYAQVRIIITTDPKILPIMPDEQGGQPLYDLMDEYQIPDNLKEIMAHSNWNDVFENLRIAHQREISGLHKAVLTISISLDNEDKPAAKECMTAFIDKLKEAVDRESAFSREVYINKYRQYHQRRREAEMQLESLLSQQSQLAGGRGALDKESVRRQRYEHEQKIVEIDIQQAMLKNRAKEISKRIYELEIEMERMNEKDPVVLQMKGALSRLETELREMERKAKESGIKILEIEEIRAMMNEKRDNLAKRENEIREVISGKIDELNHQLRETAIQQEELEIQETVLHGNSPASLSDSMQYEILEVKIAAARENLHRAILEAEAFKSELDLIMPPEIHAGKIIASEIPPKN